MKNSEVGQSLVETTILNVLIAGGVIALCSFCQKGIGQYIQSLLDFIGIPLP